MTDYDFAASGAGGRSLGGGCVVVLLVGVMMVGGMVWAANYFLVGMPAGHALDSDPRYETVELRAHLRYWIDPRVIVLDLRSVGEIDPSDLFRGVFEITRSSANLGGEFKKALLKGHGTVVFQISERSLRTVEAMLETGTDEAELIRILPEHLLTASGYPAYGETVRPVEDLADAAERWENGRGW